MIRVLAPALEGSQGRKAISVWASLGAIIDDNLVRFPFAYRAMQEKMIYEKAMPFDDVINQLKILQGRFRIKMYPTELAAIIKAAKSQLLLQADTLPEGQLITIPVTYPSNPGGPTERDNDAVTYLVTLISREGGLVFESINS